MNGPTTFLVDNEEVKVLNDRTFTDTAFGLNIKMSELFKYSPKQYLGTYYESYFPKAHGELVCLLKVLSVRTALSIQLHPDGKTAKRLHKEQPLIYKDPNPKPEIAIALSNDFIALAGFADNATIIKNFTENDVLHKLLPVLSVGEYYEPKPEDPKFLKMLVSAFLEKMDYGKEFLEDTAKRLEVEILTMKEG